MKHMKPFKKRCGPVSRISLFKRAPPRRRQDQRRFSNISQRPRFSACHVGILTFSQSRVGPDR